MSLSHYVVSFTAVVAIVILNEVYCRDASFVRQSDTQNVGARLSTRDSTQKKSTTPWPALGNDWHRSNVNIANNPIWVRPKRARNKLHNQRSNSSFNVGSNQRVNQDNDRAVVSSSEVTDDELREFSENLLNKDVNNAAQYVTFKLQSKTTDRSRKDEAPLPLLSVNKKAFKIPTIEKLLPLHNNYILHTNVTEEHTRQEKQEEENFLNKIIDTPVMQDTRNFLIQKGKIGRKSKEFKAILHDIWFNMYPRGGRKVGSSGFEHVFLTEIKKTQISGLHNWIYFDGVEKKKQANYLGYMKKIDLGNKGAILNFHFTFKGLNKPKSSMFIGTSPEFEMALYTTCFILRADKSCPLELNGKRFIIRTFTYTYREKDLIGSAFPDIDI